VIFEDSVLSCNIPVVGDI